MDSIHFSELSKQYLEIKVKRRYHIHDYFTLMEQLIYQNITGYSIAYSAKILKEASVFKMVLYKSSLDSQDSFARLWDCVSEENIL